MRGEVLATKSVLHSNVASSFVAEALENGISEQVRHELERIRNRHPDNY